MLTSKRTSDSKRLSATAPAPLLFGDTEVRALVRKRRGYRQELQNLRNLPPEEKSLPTESAETSKPPLKREISTALLTPELMEDIRSSITKLPEITQKNQEAQYKKMIEQIDGIEELFLLREDIKEGIPEKNIQGEDLIKKCQTIFEYFIKAHIMTPPEVTAQISLERASITSLAACLLQTINKLREKIKSKANLDAVMAVMDKELIELRQNHETFLEEFNQSKTSRAKGETIVKEMIDAKQAARNAEYLKFEAWREREAKNLTIESRRTFIPAANKNFNHRMEKETSFNLKEISALLAGFKIIDSLYFNIQHDFNEWHQPHLRELSKQSQLHFSKLDQTIKTYFTDNLNNCYPDTVNIFTVLGILKNALTVLEKQVAKSASTSCLPFFACATEKTDLLFHLAIQTAIEDLEQIIHLLKAPQPAIITKAVIPTTDVKADSQAPTQPAANTAATTAEVSSVPKTATVELTTTKAPQPATPAQQAERPTPDITASASVSAVGLRLHSQPKKQQQAPQKENRDTTVQCTRTC